MCSITITTTNSAEYSKDTYNLAPDAPLSECIELLLSTKKFYGQYDLMHRNLILNPEATPSQLHFPPYVELQLRKTEGTKVYLKILYCVRPGLMRQVSCRVREGCRGDELARNIRVLMPTMSPAILVDYMTQEPLTRDYLVKNDDKIVLLPMK